jgi:hypothetical protein
MPRNRLLFTKARTLVNSLSSTTIHWHCKFGLACDFLLGTISSNYIRMESDALQFPEYLTIA